MQMLVYLIKFLFMSVLFRNFLKTAFDMNVTQTVHLIKKYGFNLHIAQKVDNN